MTTFRKGDVVTIVGTIDSGYQTDGKIKVRIEPYSDVYANVADLKMVRPIIEVGDMVTYPAEGYRAGKILAILNGWCWVNVENGLGGSELFSWPLSCLNRADPEPEIEAAPVSDAA
ncbi:hypothetical protein NL532_24305 [Mesorhizobium sp. C120A]|uniref:hypothetical protein n=1 Tax=unclassified Mesorhizobium TaxID=325217 RepID=UPI0003D05B45|nr:MULTISPECIES: hypothetical protein [unclassified Mesorhizobium]ESZ60686.1 hypothetical protein X728_15260 [Mesorhizobium sp. L103C120A0]WJI43733.1 hypothetical protein NL532_24305 [Mesorhizobium sp. C120A]